MFWLWNWMVLVSNIMHIYSFSLSSACIVWWLHLLSSLFLASLLLGFVCPLMWYYATILYFGNYYHKDPRERAGLAASAIAVSPVLKNEYAFTFQLSKFLLYRLSIFSIVSFAVSNLIYVVVFWKKKRSCF